MTSELTNYDVPAFASAISKLLGNDFIGRRAIDYVPGSASRNPVGSHSCTVGDLFRVLTGDRVYREVVHRPHEVGDLKRFLKSADVLLRLHRDFNLVCSVNSNRVEICRVGWVQK